MSTLKVNTLQNTSGVEVYTAKAWVNFNGTGTVAIRASGNVSSITDNGTGAFTVNFTNSMSDANYSAICNASDDAVSNTAVSLSGTTALQSSNVRLNCWIGNYGAGGQRDPATVTVAIFR